MLEQCYYVLCQNKPFLAKMRSIMEQTHTKHIVLGLTGGIAAYKAAELTRLLVKQNIEVQVVMTEAACHFITATTLQALSGKPVFINQWDDAVESNAAGNGMAHINLSRSADAIVIAPASADRVLWIDLAQFGSLHQVA